MKHLLSLEEMSREEMEHILEATIAMKQERGRHSSQPLAGKVWALLFSKSSTRTRVSFEVGIRELGGQALFLSSGDAQLGRGEPIRDTARVLGRMIHGAVIRTFAQRDVEEFAEYGRIPTINALTDDEHPCQVLTDIFTFQEKRGPIAGKRVTFIGDGACNVPTSWIFAAAKKLGIRNCELPRPKNFNQAAGIIAARSAGGKIIVTEDLRDMRRSRRGPCFYTDVWVSMGKEAESAERLGELAGYQINETLVKLAKPDALVMHCLPAYRGKEIDEATFEAHAQTIFDQAENRLHCQKAIMTWLVS